MTILPGGIGASSGDTLVTTGVLFTSGDVYYVDSETGSDANGGKSRLDPKATLSSAVSAAFAGDMIVLLSTHAETLTAALAISKTLVIVGEGASSGLPTVKFTLNAAAANLFNITGDGVELRNIFFEEESKSCSAARILVNADRVTMHGCYFQIDGNLTPACVSLYTNAADIFLENCTFVSTSAAQSDPADNDPPSSAVSSENAITGLRIKGCVFDGGSIGFSGYALDLSDSAITDLRVEGMSLLRGADVSINASSTGYVQTPTVTGSSRVEGMY
ncbi:MAG: hypothetical protein ACWGQW_02220 [bacterium]